MKKAFTIASLVVWTLGLLVGMGFAVAGEVTETNKLPGENHLLWTENNRLQTENNRLQTERDSLENTVATERNRVDRYLASIGHLEFQNKMIVDYLRLDAPIVTSVGSWLHEE